MDKLLPNGVILPKIGAQSFEYGGMTPVGTDIIIPDGNAIPFLPVFETQANTYFDTWGCVGHSHDNALQTDAKARYGIDVDFSDRDIVVLSGTVPRVGNSGEAVLESVQINGVIPQELGDWDSRNRDSKVNIEEVYYSYKRSEEGVKAAKIHKDNYEIIGEWVHRSNWQEASKRGVLQLYVQAWYINSKGEYYSPTGKFNHAVIMADYRTRKIFDSYEPRIKTLDSWDSIYPWALKINLIKKNMAKPIIKNNTLVQAIYKGEGGGQFGLYLDDKILIGDLAELLATFYMRNNGETVGKTMPLNKEQWDMFTKRPI